jgi:hypothetical protein
MATTYILQSATFKSTSITDVTAATIDESSSPSTISTDGSRNVNLVVVDNKTVSITVESTNQALGNTANFRVGQAGQLVLVTKLRSAGDGVSTSLTITVPECVLVSNSSGDPTQAAGTFTMSFQAYDSANDGLISYS